MSRLELFLMVGTFFSAKIPRSLSKRLRANQNRLGRWAISLLRLKRGQYNVSCPVPDVHLDHNFVKLYYRVATYAKIGHKIMIIYWRKGRCSTQVIMLPRLLLQLLPRLYACKMCKPKNSMPVTIFITGSLI